MHITLAKTAPNGVAIEHHQVRTVLLEPPIDYLQVLLHSWPTAASAASGYAEVWRWHVHIPLTALDPELEFREAVLAALVATPDWVGGTASL